MAINYNYGSICLSDLISEAKNGNKAFKRSETNGKIYCDVVLFHNEAPDEKNRISTLAISKDKESEEKTKYIGTFFDRPKVNNEPIENDLPEDDDLPF